MLLPCWLLIFRTSAEGHLGFMEGTEAYFLFEDANKIHYCKVRLLCLDLKKKKIHFSLALEADTGLNIPYTTELRRHEGELSDTMYLKSKINIKNNFQIINLACLPG